MREAIETWARHNEYAVENIERPANIVLLGRTWKKPGDSYGIREGHRELIIKLNPSVIIHDLGIEIYNPLDNSHSLPKDIPLSDNEEQDQRDIRDKFMVNTAFLSQATLVGGDLSMKEFEQFGLPNSTKEHLCERAIMDRLTTRIANYGSRPQVSTRRPLIAVMGVGRLEGPIGCVKDRLKELGLDYIALRHK